MTTLTLYRGDYEKIKQFDFHKTNKYCWVGPGVYLTESLSVAESYRTKGSSSGNKPRILFEGKAKDRPDAIDKAFDTYFRAYHLDLLPYKERKTAEWNEKARKHAYALYQALLQEGKIKASYAASLYRDRRPELLKVELETEETTGFITEFAFEKEDFEPAIVRIDKPIKDRMFWEILFERKVNFGLPAITKDEYLGMNLGRSYWGNNCALRPGARLTKEELTSVRKAISQFGYKGFEYSGGVPTGGSIRHRAFCVWDDAYVNQHRVRRFR